MIKDYHPTPDVREFEKTANVSIDGVTMTLRFSALDYGTHTGAVFRLCDANGNELLMLPFEAHWHQRGRYLIQVGPAKTGGADLTLADTIAAIAGEHIAGAITAAQAHANARPDMFDNIAATAGDVLSAIAGATSKD